MGLSRGTCLGPYEIIALIGAGGMGEVYRARDNRLDREVAVKILPAHLTHDLDRSQRFNREARAISTLNHPNICTLYDIGKHDDAEFLVMELIEGETLEQRLSRGPLPIDQVLARAIEIADALSRAHRKGIVHRDLKPGNIMLARSGTGRDASPQVKLLDFGLAKLRRSDSEGLGATATAVPITEAGMILGTVQYMSPEQLDGLETDARTDLFALGAVIYEMTTGRRAFEGKSRASLISNILTADPPAMSAVVPMTPPLLDRLVRKCLAKDPEERWQSAQDVALALGWLRDEAAVGRHSIDASVGSDALGPRVEFQIRLQDGGALPAVEDIPCFPEVSPDGSSLAFVARTRKGTNGLWIRRLDHVDVIHLAGTDDASFPFWSPDSQHIAFFADRKLKRISLVGGPIQVVCDAEGGRGGTWSTTGLIVFARHAFSPLFQVPASGGVPIQVTSLDDTRAERSHRFPRFLPDGKQFVYFVLLSPEQEDSNGGSFISSLEGGPRRLLMSQGSTCQFVPTGHMLFFRDSNIMAQRVTAGALSAVGEPIPVAHGVGHHHEKRLAHFSVSDTGVLAYAPQPQVGLSRLCWRDRTGRELETVGEPCLLKGFRISRDGEKLAMSIEDDHTKSASLWVLEFDRDVSTRVTADVTRQDDWPTWLPAGDHLFFSTVTRRASANLRRVALSGSSLETTVSQSYGEYPCDCSPDGEWLAYERFNIGTNRMSIWLRPCAQGGEPKPLIETAFRDVSGQFSPDGRWLAYVSNESGRDEVYVVPIEGSGTKRRLSKAGGDQPRWRRDGKELFFVTEGGVLVAVDINLGPPFAAGVARSLFPLARTRSGQYLYDYDVSPDGERFLVRTLEGDQVISPFTVILNWPSVLKER